MTGLRNDQGKDLLTLFIYMDGLTGMLTRGRQVLSRDSITWASIHSAQEEIQSTLGRFYDQSQLPKSDLQGVDLVFVNSIFHPTSSGRLETYKNRLPAFLLYHKEYFDVVVQHRHIARQLQIDLKENFAQSTSPALWFHLRRNILFVAFCTSTGETSITSFKVQKMLDVYYYILFNYQTLQTTLPGLNQVVVSGELVDMDKIHNFFEENVPDVELVSYWQWKGIPGKPQVELGTFLPEVIL